MQSRTDNILLRFGERQHELAPQLWLPRLVLRHWAMRAICQSESILPGGPIL